MSKTICVRWSHLAYSQDEKVSMSLLMLLLKLNIFTDYALLEFQGTDFIEITFK